MCQGLECHVPGSRAQFHQTVSFPPPPTRHKSKLSSLLLISSKLEVSVMLSWGSINLLEQLTELSKTAS